MIRGSMTCASGCKTIILSAAVDGAKAVRSFTRTFVLTAAGNG